MKLLEKLEERFIKGEIRLNTYKKLKSRFEERLLILEELEEA